jgi:acyl-CoA thioesterase-1
MKKGFKKIEIWGLILTVIIACIVIWYPRTQYRQDKVVIAFGDSLTRGYGIIPPERNYVVYLSNYVHIPILNASQTGDTTSEALIRLKEGVLDKKPDIVIVFLGGNDYLAGYSSEVVKTNLKTIVHKIEEAGARVILLGGDPQMAGGYEKVFQEVVNEEKVFAYIPAVLNGILFRKDLMYDGIHPNEKGHEIIAQKILPALQRALSEK